MNNRVFWVIVRVLGSCKIVMGRDASIRYSGSVLARSGHFRGSGIGETRPIQIRYCVYTILLLL